METAGRRLLASHGLDLAALRAASALTHRIVRRAKQVAAILTAEFDRHVDENLRAKENRGRYITATADRRIPLAVIIQRGVSMSRNFLFVAAYCGLIWILAVRAQAEAPAFRLHVVNPESTYCACAAIDVNVDGKLDIVCGGFWYEAPSWQKHFLREVQMIRGRYDDYSHLPMDVNRDGRMDYVSANYRSESIYWVENPGPEGAWPKHVIEVPGPMETAILCDVDGDGQNDVLPNGTKFAAWWELIQEASGDGSVTPRWERHDLPVEAAGHGVGFGDIDGDGRGDVVGPHGWLEAPEDPRGGRWTMHHDFELEKDCSVPMLVADVDHDGDSDLLVGRGHNFGLYWLEQGKSADGSRSWTRHAIDTSWSVAHAILWEDIDNDGAKELIAGKRYLAHDGRDPGEYDPLVAYYYDYDPARRTWDRHDIEPGGPAGFGLDPKVIDLDADGDLDILAPGRSGLHWFENLLLANDRSTPSSVPVAPPTYTDHSRVMVVKNADGTERPVTTPFDLGLRRSHILAGMEQAMGPFPPMSMRVPLDVEVLEETDAGKYVRRRITYAAEPGDRVPAYLLIPKELKQQAPAMLCLHQTTNIGKGEPVGLGLSSTLDYAHELADRGYVCIAPDYPSFGDYSYDFKTQGSHYASGSMKAIWNNVRAVDLLIAMPEVDADRIGCIGHSLGGHNALFTATFDQRLRAVVTSCGFTAFHHYYGGKLAGWTSDRYMPRIRDQYGNDPDRVPFDFYEVLTAITPRGIFINAPQHDGNFELVGVQKVVDQVSQAYELRGVPNNLVAQYPDSGHDFPDEVREEAYDWLEQTLK